MPRLTAALLAALLLAGPALAQSWPADAGIQRDALRGAIGEFDRVRQYPAPRQIGEERREAITGALDGAWAWIRGRADMVGDRDPEARRYFDLRRQWEGEWLRR